MFSLQFKTSPLHRPVFQPSQFPMCRPRRRPLETLTVISEGVSPGIPLGLLQPNTRVSRTVVTSWPPLVSALPFSPKNPLPYSKPKSFRWVHPSPTFTAGYRDWFGVSTRSMLPQADPVMSSPKTCAGCDGAEQCSDQASRIDAGKPCWR